MHTTINKKYKRTMSTQTDPSPTDVAVAVAVDVEGVEVKINEEVISSKSSSASTTLTDTESSTSSNTAEAILVDLDKDKQLDYWKKRAMKKIHENRAINKKNIDLREKIGVLNTKNQELRQDVEENTRHKINYLEKIELLQGEIECLKSKSRRSLVSSNYSITEHEIEAIQITKDKRELLSARNYTITEHEIETVQIAKDRRELLSAGKHRELQALIGTSFRSKWSDRFIGESRDE